MINSKELRIGNWVNVPREDQCPFRIDSIEYLDKSFGKVGMIHPIHGESFHPLTWYLENLTPIPITPEILISCGFKKESFYYRMRISDQFSLIYGKMDGIIISGKDNECDSLLDHIQYLHQLQNLHQILTNTELNYQPE